MGYDEEPPRIRRLTPLESELRIPAPAPPARSTPWRRYRSWRAARRPPQTLRGVLVRGLLRLAVAGATGTGAALLLAHLLGRPVHVGFYLAGAAVLAFAFMYSAADMGSPYQNQFEREHRVRASFSYVLVGAVLIGVAVALERFA